MSHRQDRRDFGSTHGLGVRSCGSEFWHILTRIRYQISTLTNADPNPDLLYRTIIKKNNYRDGYINGM